MYCEPYYCKMFVKACIEIQRKKSHSRCNGCTIGARAFIGLENDDDMVSIVEDQALRNIENKEKSLHKDFHVLKVPKIKFRNRLSVREPIVSELERLIKQ